MLLRLAPVGDIAEIHRQSLRKWISPHLQPLAKCREIRFHFDAPVGPERVGELVAQQTGERLAEPAPHRQTQQIARGFLQQALAFLVQVGEAALAVQRHKGLGDAGQRGGETHRQAHGFFLRLLLGGNVLHGALDADHPSLRIAYRIADGANPLHTRVGQHHLHFFVEPLAQRGAALQPLAHGGAPLRRITRDHECQIPVGVGLVPSE